MKKILILFGIFFVMCSGESKNDTKKDDIFTTDADVLMVKEVSDWENVDENLEAKVEESFDLQEKNEIFDSDAEEFAINDADEAVFDVMDAGETEVLEKDFLEEKFDDGFVGDEFEVLQEEILHDADEFFDQDQAEIYEIEEKFDLNSDDSKVDTALEQEDEQGSCLDVYPGMVIITEILVCSDQAENCKDKEFVELYNASDKDLFMKQWVLKDGAGNEISLTLKNGKVFKTKSYLIVAVCGDESKNGGLLPEIVAPELDVESGVLTIEAGEVIVDNVDYSTFPVSEGRSFCLMPDKFSSWENDKIENWGVSGESYFNGFYGTPKNENSGCMAMPVCGNGTKEVGEECDDGKNGDNNDGCTDFCKFSCHVDSDCADKSGDCAKPVCVEGGNGQICDTVLDENDFFDDNNECTQDFCDLDGISQNIPVSNGKECDNNNDVFGDYCIDGVCSDPVCGDGIKGPSEECDDGNLKSGDGCSSECKIELLPKCPEDMVFVPENPEKGIFKDFCIDKWEASRKDATQTDMGSDISIAVSKPGVIPWYVNPMNSQHFAEFKNACKNAGKRLCKKEEWAYFCSGNDNNVYAFGNDFDPEICNCVDTFCDDFCEQNGIPESDCITTTNCGYTYYCFKVMPTGSFPDCVNSFGAYDINGNVWEIVDAPDSPDGYEIRGGAFNCGNPQKRLRCDFVATWKSLYAGFRCCKDPGQ